MLIARCLILHPLAGPLVTTSVRNSRGSICPGILLLQDHRLSPPEFGRDYHNPKIKNNFSKTDTQKLQPHLTHLLQTSYLHGKAQSCLLQSKTYGLYLNLKLQILVDEWLSLLPSFDVFAKSIGINLMTRFNWCVYFLQLVDLRVLHYH